MCTFLTSTTGYALAINPQQNKRTRQPKPTWLIQSESCACVLCFGFTLLRKKPWEIKSPVVDGAFPKSISASVKYGQDLNPWLCISELNLNGHENAHSAWLSRKGNVVHCELNFRRQTTKPRQALLNPIVFKQQKFKYIECSKYK